MIKDFLKNDSRTLMIEAVKADLNPAMAEVPFEPGKELMALEAMEDWLVHHHCVRVQEFFLESRPKSNIKAFVVYYLWRRVA